MLAPMNTARHYHSSCSFQERSVYVFCGISNESKKYLNSIERLDIITTGGNGDIKSLNENKKWSLLGVTGIQLLNPR